MPGRDPTYFSRGWIPHDLPAPAPGPEFRVSETGQCRPALCCNEGAELPSSTLLLLLLIPSMPHTCLHCLTRSTRSCSTSRSLLVTLACPSPALAICELLTSTILVRYQVPIMSDPLGFRACRWLVHPSQSPSSRDHCQGYSGRATSPALPRQPQHGLAGSNEARCKSPPFPSACDTIALRLGRIGLPTDPY